MRWHPDKLNRYLVGDGKEVVSRDSRIKISERQIGTVVDRVIRKLKDECEEALK